MADRCVQVMGGTGVSGDTIVEHGTTDHPIALFDPARLASA